MLGRLLQGLFAALVVIALIAVPALALRPGPPTDAPQAPAAEQPAQAQDEEDDEAEDGAGKCHGIQRAYWAVTSNPGRGKGKSEAAGELVNRAAELGCELSDAPAERWRGGPPPWAGQHDDETEAEGAGRGGPPWATEGDGPPWGMAWGYWLKHGGGEGVCERIAARLHAHPNAVVPEDLRQRITDELGCQLP